MARDTRFAVIAGSADSAPSRDLAVAEFFAGAGLARLGLEAAGFRVAWSNDYSAKKHRMYRGHFRDPAERHVFVEGRIEDVDADDLPRGLALAWASFPCTDLSLAGNGEGINEGESKTFWEFARLIGELGDDAPEVVCLENVSGLASTDGGDNLRAAVGAMNDLGYSVDVLCLDARRFVPQSRERLFLVCAKTPPTASDDRVSAIRPAFTQFIRHEDTFVTHAAALPEPPDYLAGGLGEIVESMPDDDARWWSEARTSVAMASLSAVQAARIELLKQHRRPVYRTGYRRTRKGAAVWEFRDDDVSGCLRTARGGSSKQALIRVCDGAVAMRWMTPREYARLMGAGDYALGAVTEAQAIFGFGDAVCVPVVRWLAKHYLMPLLSGELDVDAATAIAR